MTCLVVLDRPNLEDVRDPTLCGGMGWSPINSGLMIRAQVTRSFVESPEYVAITDTSVFSRIRILETQTHLVRRAFFQPTR